MSAVKWYSRGEMGEWLRDNLDAFLWSDVEDYEGLIDVLNEAGLTDSEILEIILQERAEKG